MTTDYSHLWEAVALILAMRIDSHLLVLVPSLVPATGLEEPIMATAIPEHLAPPMLELKLVITEMVGLVVPISTVRILASRGDGGRVVYAEQFTNEMGE
jgi:hypothetical protein